MIKCTPFVRQYGMLPNEWGVYYAESGMQDLLVSLHSESIQFGGATVSKQERRPLFHRKKCDGVDKHTPFYSIAQTGTANLIAPVF